MLQRKNHSPVGSKLVKESLWNLVLYFVYFFTFLFWIRFVGVCAQGNRGVFVNNQLFDDSGGAKKLHPTNAAAIHLPSISASSTIRPYSRPLSFQVSDDSNEFKYSAVKSHSFGFSGQVNRWVVVNNQKFDESKPYASKALSTTPFSTTTFKPPRFGSSLSTYKPWSIVLNDSNESKYSKSQPAEVRNKFGVQQLNRGVIVNNQKVDELQPINRFKSQTTTTTRRPPSFNFDNSNESKYSRFQQKQVFESSGHVKHGEVINKQKVDDSVDNNPYANRHRARISNTIKSNVFVPTTTTSTTTIRPYTFRTSTHRPPSFKYDISNEFRLQHTLGAGMSPSNRGVIINNHKVDDPSDNQYVKLQHSNAFKSTTFKPPTQVHSTFRTPPPKFRDGSSDYQYFKSQQSNLYKSFSTTTTTTTTEKSPSFERFKLSTFRPLVVKYENSSNPFLEWQHANLFNVHTFSSTTTKRPTFATSTHKPSMSMLSTFRQTPLKFDEYSSDHRFPEIQFGIASKAPVFFQSSTTTRRPQTIENDDLNEFKSKYTFQSGGQVNRGGIVNNHKFDEPEPAVNRIKPSQFYSSTTVKPTRFVSSTTPKPPSFIFNYSNDFEFPKPQQLFTGSGSDLIFDKTKVNDNHSSESQKYAKPQQTNTLKSTGRPSIWPIESNDSSSAQQRLDLHHSQSEFKPATSLPPTTKKSSLSQSPFSTFESIHFHHSNNNNSDSDVSDLQTSEFQHSNFFNPFSSTPKPPRIFKPTNLDFDDISSDSEHFNSQPISAIKSSKFPLSTYEPVSFVSTIESQVPIDTAKRHPTVHPRTTSTTSATTTTTTTTTATQNASLSFQGFLAADSDNPTYIDDDIVDVDDNHDHENKNNDDDDDGEWSSLPIISPPAKGKILDPEYVTGLFSIENILERNNSDWEKLDELINKVNETGGLAKVNVLNATKRIDNDIDMFDPSALASEQKFTYAKPYETKSNRVQISYDAEKGGARIDAKDLKVQFVLDCDLKDSTSGEPNLADLGDLVERPVTSPSPFNLPSSAARPTALPYTSASSNQRPLGTSGPRPSVQYPSNMMQQIYNSQRISTTRAPRPMTYDRPSNGMYYQTPTKRPQMYSSYTTGRPSSYQYPTRRKGQKRPLQAQSQSQSNQMYQYPTKTPSKPSYNNQQQNSMYYYPTKAPSPVRSTAQANAVYYYPNEGSPSNAPAVESNAIFYYPTKFAVKPTTAKPSTMRVTARPPARTTTTTRKPTKTGETKATKRPPVRNIYVDPPMVAAIADTFDNVYNYFENAMTTKVKVEDNNEDPTPAKSFTRKRGKKRPVMKRSTVRDRMPVTESSVPIIYMSTQPQFEKRYTQGFTDKNGQKLTTNIQVTSEYTGKEPVTDRPIKDESSSESDYGGDYYTEDDYSGGSSSESGIRDEEDDDDSDDEGEDEDSESEDSSSDYGLSLGIDDEYDDDDSGEDQFDGPPPTRKNKRKHHNRRQYKKPTKKKPSSSEEEDDDDAFGGFSMPNVGSYFKKTINSISDYMPPLPFAGDEDDDDDDVDDGEQSDDEYDDSIDKDDDSNTSIRRPKFKYTLKKIFRRPLQLLRPNRADGSKRRRWYDKFFFGSEDDSQPKDSSESTTEQSKFMDWFRLNSEASTERSVAIPTPSTTTKSWFPNLFFGGSTTPAPSAEVTDKVTSVPNTKIFLDMLTSQMANAAQKFKESAAKREKERKDTGPKRVTYEDYQIWRLTPSTEAHLEFLKEYKDFDYSERIVWIKGPSLKGLNDIVVPPDMNKEFQEIMEEETIPYEVLVWDLEKAIKYENPMMTRRQRLELENEQGHPMTWHRYHNYEDIAVYLDYLQMTYPDIVDLIHIGRSFEGRPLMILKISFEPVELESYTEDILLSGKKNSQKFIRPAVKTRRKKKVHRPGIFIEAGVHGREWITPAAATWIIKEIIKHNNTEDGNPEKEILRSVDWYIMPVSNPDGYEYSLNFDRLWHKTRSKHAISESMIKQALNWLKRDSKFSSKTCYGADPDRNYNIEWQKYESPSACSDYYEGPKAFSEPETKALAGFLDENRHYINMFVSLHAYGQMITYPPTVNTNDLRDMAEVAANALRDLASSGRYTIDHSNEMRAPTSGSSTDYAMYVSNIKYSYRVELRDTGTQGFLLSPSYIDTTGLEAFEMVKAMINYF